MEKLEPAESDIRIIDPSYYSDAEDGDFGQTGQAGGALADMAWEAWARCLFILMMLALVCLLTWRPSMTRLNLLFSLISPSRGERLEWRAVDDPTPLPPPVKRTSPPAEWRSGRSLSGHWTLSRHPAALPVIDSGEVVSRTWMRITDNAWSWHDDASRLRRNDVEAVPPSQKSMTAFRAGDGAAWSTAIPAAAARQNDIPFFAAPNPPEIPRTAGEQTVEPIQEIAAAPALAATGDAAAAFPGPSSSAALPGADGATRAPLPAAQPAAAASSPARPSIDGAAPGEADWKNSEITGPIKDAYLIIYPKLRFIGLCVPGQGYIRKYNQVGVPREIEGGKMRADDGRVPYGRYYIADRNLDADGPRLFLSWPSPEDAKRIGLDDVQLQKVENAWKREGLPPQNTAAGGGVGLNGLRRWVELTDGGFSLEAPHMEEIFTALPDKAKVLIQP